MKESMYQGVIIGRISDDETPQISAYQTTEKKKFEDHIANRGPCGEEIIEISRWVIKPIPESKLNKEIYELLGEEVQYH